MAHLKMAIPIFLDALPSLLKRVCVLLTSGRQGRTRRTRNHCFHREKNIPCSRKFLSSLQKHKFGWMSANSFSPMSLGMVTWGKCQENANDILQEFMASSVCAAASGLSSAARRGKALRSRGCKSCADLTHLRVPELKAKAVSAERSTWERKKREPEMWNGSLVLLVGTTAGKKKKGGCVCARAVRAGYAKSPASSVCAEKGF